MGHAGYSRRLSSASIDVQNDLCGKRLVANLVEWCDTPFVRTPGFATTDGCWMFDETDGRLRSVAPCAAKNIYLAVPHPCSDPVMEANKERVMEFLRTTFFDNALALDCQLAAICLTLRGISIVRAFITLGPGCVGQSLNTALIANMFGHMHGFVDMNVFYTGDELRKQAETFSGKVCMSQMRTHIFSEIAKLRAIESSVIVSFWNPLAVGGDYRARGAEHGQAAS